MDDELPCGEKMLPLTALEYALLDCQGRTHDRQETIEEDAAHRELIRRGLLVVTDEGEWIAYTPTPKGDLAVRIHKAYLQSRSS